MHCRPIVRKCAVLIELICSRHAIKRCALHGGAWVNVGKRSENRREPTLIRLDTEIFDMESSDEQGTYRR